MVTALLYVAFATSGDRRSCVFAIVGEHFSERLSLVPSTCFRTRRAGPILMPSSPLHVEMVPLIGITIKAERSKGLSLSPFYQLLRNRHHHSFGPNYLPHQTSKDDIYLLLYLFHVFLPSSRNAGSHHISHNLLLSLGRFVKEGTLLRRRAIPLLRMLLCQFFPALGTSAQWSDPVGQHDGWHPLYHA